MNVSALVTRPSRNADREEFYRRLDKKNAAPLWEVLADLVTPEPRPQCIPYLWRFEELRPMLMESGGLISAQEAERRVLVLENPGIRGRSQITNSLYAGIQLVLPGEITPSHRHTASALRFVMESTGGYTAVDGERTTMQPGDFVITPSWTFHDHGNTTSSPTIWMDVLDVPIVNLLDSSFAEHRESTQPLTRPEGDSMARFGTNLLPVNYKSASLTAPIFTYPYARSREALDQLYRNGPVHEAHGVKMQFVNPVSGGPPMPTIQSFIQLLPNGFSGQAYRSTDATIYCVAEGSGQSEIGGQTFQWTKHDIFVIPSWCPVAHRASKESVLFSASDRPVQKALGLWREQ